MTCNGGVNIKACLGNRTVSSLPCSYLTHQHFDADILRIHGLHWQQSWNCFFPLEPSKILRHLWILHIAFLITLLPSLSMLPSGIKNIHATKQTNCTAKRQVENCASESKRVCDCLIRGRLGSSHAGKKNGTVVQVSIKSCTHQKFFYRKNHMR